MGMQVEAVRMDALVGEETLSRLFSGQLITSESGPEPSIPFFCFWNGSRGAARVHLGSVDLCIFVGVSRVGRI
jgi:hypothetical protein